MKEMSRKNFFLCFHSLTTQAPWENFQNLHQTVSCSRCQGMESGIQIGLKDVGSVVSEVFPLKNKNKINNQYFKKKMKRGDASY